jgi:hypothetical protein
MLRLLSSWAEDLRGPCPLSTVCCALPFLLAGCFAQGPLAAVSQTTADGAARIEGQVFSATTGEPLKKVQVLLASDDKHRYATSTDAQGKFVFEGIPPGDYSLSAERVAYLNRHAESDISASPGASVKDVVLKLIPAGVIAGRVLDEDGDPVPDSQAAIERYVGKRFLESDSAEVNGEGGFTFTGLKPGRYYLSASKDRRGPAPQPGSKAAEEAFADTYYPGAPDRARAVPLDLKPGGEIRNVDIRLRKQRVFRVRGRVTGTDSDESLKLTLQAQPGHAFSSSTNRGYFEFVDVPSGSYWIRVAATQTSFDRSTFSMTSKRQTLFCNYAVEVADKNLDDLVVPLAPGATIIGKVSADGVKAESMHADTPLHVSLSAVESFLPSAPNAAVGADGTFQIESLPYDRFQVVIGPLPDSAYLKSIRFNAQEVVGKRIDLTSGAGGTLEIVIAPNAAEIAGVVRKPNGDPTARATLQAWAQGADHPEFARPGKDGFFVFHNLAPGEYTVYAWQEEEAGDGTIDDPDFRKRFDAQAVTIKLDEKSRENVEVKLIGKEAMDAEAAKIP